jgi:ribA/ribD-fused uncharacterized protein
MEAVMDSENILCFYREKDPYGELSNWIKSPFMYAGMNFESVLQFLMFHKVMLFGQRRLAHQIMSLTDPTEIKKIGNAKFDGYSDMQWDVTCEGIISRGLIAKFSQNQDMCRVLLGTGNRIIAFATPLDEMWGTGIAINNPEACNVFKWTGKNRLGKVLMQTRELLRYSILAFGEIPKYVDIRDAEPIPEDKMTPGELIQEPIFTRAIRTYLLSLPDKHAKDTCLWGAPLGKMDTNILSLPRAGFMEMKQEIYDLARLRHCTSDITVND